MAVPRLDRPWASPRRTEAGGHEGDRAFRRDHRIRRHRWRRARHNVRLHRTAAKRVHNPLAGDLELTGDALELPGDGLTLITYTAAADSHAQEQPDFLASWSANRQHD
jgi:hypothetical protein